MKPILFNTEMVKAILDGTKKQTRRPIKLNIKKDNKIHSLNGAVFTIDNKLYFEHNLIENFSKYKVDDILYVKEPCKIMTLKGCHSDKSLILVYKYRNDITNTEYEIKLPDRFYGKDNAVPDWVSWFGKTTIPSGSIKEMARIFLKVTNVRVERLQDIIVDDCIAEGIVEYGGGQIGDTGCYGDVEYTIGEMKFDEDEMYPISRIYDDDGEAFADLWNSTAKDGYKWEDNPYVFVYEFERVDNGTK